MRPIIAFAVLCAGAATASATIVSRDLHTTGDGLITRDLDNGLDWLDWTQGLQYSYIDMLNEFGPGGAFEGWRYATQAELDAFMISAGVPDLGQRTVANVPSVTNILSLLGANDYYFSLGLGNSSVAFIHDSTNAGPGGFVDHIAFTIETFDNPVRAKAGELGMAINNFAFGSGHALVRVIPAPGSAALLAVGGLVATRRRR